jgi:thymidylate synthase (FAD)
MPNDETIPVVDIPTKVKYKQIPLTKAVDWINNIEVKLLDYPDPARYRRMAFTVQRATWSRTLEEVLKKTEAKTDEDIEKAVLEAAGGLSLGLNLEMAQFTFAVGGISRILTHQIVRTRIGVTYSQRCSGDQDIRHDDMLVPRDIYADHNAYVGFLTHTLEFKQWYAENADKGFEDGSHSIQTLRYMAPHNLSQYIIVSGSLLALMALIGKRMCTNETVEYNRVADLYRQLIIEKFPEFTDFLKADCDKKSKCFFMRGHSPMNGNIYLPDAKHDFPYNKENFMYPYTRAHMLEDYSPVPTRYYQGINEISHDEYDAKLKEYETK